MIPGIAIGVLGAAVPFVLSRLFGAGDSSSGPGLFRTHTARPMAEPSPSSQRLPALRNVPIVTRTELPPATMPLIDPWASEPAAPMPTPPPDGFVSHRRTQAEVDEMDARRPLTPTEPAPQRLPAIREPAPTADTPPPAMPEPPPFVEPQAIEAPAQQATEDDRPPQERGELPAELAALPAPTADTPPAGYDPVKARSLAKQVASNITNRGNSYSRDLLKQFQRFAGIASEGIYGGESRGALEFYGVRRPPVALFRPTATVPYRWATWS